jgi:AcrR family transcriptional regulator
MSTTSSSLNLSPILSVTLSQIVAVGYHATTVRSIARDVGVTVPALYYHYENKQAMLVALLNHAMDIVEEQTSAALNSAGPAPEDQLAALVEAIALYMANHRELAFLDSERRALEPDNYAAYIKRRDGIEEHLRTILVKGHDQGVFATDHPKECARAILSMCQGISAWFRAEGRKSAEDVAAQYRQFALSTAGYKV